jgi:hypothetical protein
LDVPAPAWKVFAVIYRDALHINDRSRVDETGVRNLAEGLKTRDGTEVENILKKLDLEKFLELLKISTREEKTRRFWQLFFDRFPADELFYFPVELAEDLTEDDLELFTSREYQSHWDFLESQIDRSRGGRWKDPLTEVQRAQAWVRSRQRQDEEAEIRRWRAMLAAEREEEKADVGCRPGRPRHRSFAQYLKGERPVCRVS